MERGDDSELAAARDEVLAAVERLGERGGPSLRPASVHAKSPLSAVPVEVSGERPTVVERRALSAARRWQSSLDWIGGLGGSIERRLLLVACELVTRIAAGPVWAGGAFDGPRPDLAAELDQLEEHAHHLAELRRETTRNTLADQAAQQAADPAPAEGGTTSAQDSLVAGWSALVDRVAALALYAQRLADLAEGPDQDAAARAEELAARAVTDSVRDEMAADHLRILAQDLAKPQLE